MRLAALIVLLAPIGCASAQPQPPSDLSLDERQVLESALRYKRHEFQSLRGVLVLDATETWLPDEESVAEARRRPEDLSEETWAQVRPPDFPEGLRAVNDRSYRVGGLRLPPGFRLFGWSRFERVWTSSRSTRVLDAELGKPAPLVLSFSRPYIAAGGDEAFVVEHVLSTWSGCGGVNILRATRTQDGEWRADFFDMLLLW